MSASAISPAGQSSQPRRWQSAPGKFEGGTWFCACEPPLPAAFLQVKKNGENKGRWFYTCPKPRDEQCRFFLFEDAADALERRALEQRSVFGNAAAGSSVATDSSNHVTSNTADMGTSAGNNAGPSNGKERANRAETPHSEAASTMHSGPLYSPRSSVFPTPGPRQRIFRGIPQTSWSSDDDDDSDYATDGYPSASTPTPGPKRKRSGDHDDDEAARHGARKGKGRGSVTTRTTTADLSDVDSDDALQLAALADETERRHRLSQSQSQQSVPSSQRSHLSDAPSPSTPSSRRLGASSSSNNNNNNYNPRTGFGFGGLPTPESGNSFLAPSAEPGAKRLKTADSLAAAAAAATASTPTPARTRNVFAGPAAAAAAAAARGSGGGPGPLSQQQGDYCSEDDADVTVAVLGLLQAEPVSAAVRRAVRETLNLSALRARGVERARDLLREGIKARDRTIASLQAKVVRLEGDRRVGREVLKKAASELEALCQEGEGEADGEGKGAA